MSCTLSTTNMKIREKVFLGPPQVFILMTKKKSRGPGTIHPNRRSFSTPIVPVMRQPFHSGSRGNISPPLYIAPEYMKIISHPRNFAPGQDTF